LARKQETNLIVPFALIVRITPLAIVSSLAVVAGIYFFSRGLSLLARKRQLSATVSTIGSALPGLVQVNGIATGPKTISAPITGQPCYLYRTTVWQQRNGAAGEWRKAAEETLHVPFFLNDSTGQLLIEARGAELDLQNEFHKEYDSLLPTAHELPRSVSFFLARHEVSTARRIRIEECCIRPESVVFVAGAVTENPGVEIYPTSRRTEDTARRRADTPEVIRLSVGTEPLPVDAMTQQSKIAAALVKAGMQPPNAWDAGGAPSPATGDNETQDLGELAPNGKREGQRSEAVSARSTPALVLMRGSADTPFVISWRGRRELSRTYIWQSMVMFCGGAVLTLAGLYVLLLRMHLP
jgi:E3 ubiquitin ligase